MDIFAGDLVYNTIRLFPIGHGIDSICLKMGSPKVYANRRESNNSTAPDANAIKSSPSSLTFNWRAI